MSTTRTIRPKSGKAARAGVTVAGLAAAALLGGASLSAVAAALEPVVITMPASSSASSGAVARATAEPAKPVPDPREMARLMRKIEADRDNMARFNFMMNHWKNPYK